jgi:TRAP-type C4-dicarboxylate transport system permease small subunit
MKYLFTSFVTVSFFSFFGIFTSSQSTYAADCHCTCSSGTTVIAESTQPSVDACTFICQEFDKAEEVRQGKTLPGTTPSCTGLTTQNNCKSDEECPLGQVCKNQLCIESECNETKKCKNAGEVCAGGQCVAGQCNASIPCPAGKICQGVKCVNSPSKSGAEILKTSNPIKANDIRGALGRVINIFTGVSGTIALLMFIYGGILYVFSAGDDTRVKQAQSVFKWATLGLVLIFTSYAVVNQVFTALNTRFSAEGIAYPDIYPLGNIAPGVLVGKIIQYILSVIGVAALLVFIWGGFQYFMSFGDAKKAEAGRKTLIYAVIGLIVIFTSYAATSFIINTLSLTGSTTTNRPQTGQEEAVPPNQGQTDEELRETILNQINNGGTATTPVACGSCSCIIKSSSSSPTGTIEERPQGNVDSITECSNRCKQTFGDNFIRTQCK